MVCSRAPASASPHTPPLRASDPRTPRAVLAIAAAGQLGPVRLAAAASGIVQPGAPDLSEAQGLIDGASSEKVATSGTNLQKCLRWLADVTPESWADQWLPLEVVQDVIDNGRV